MNCRNVEEKLMDLLQPGNQTSAVAMHVAGCAHCSAQLQALRQTFATLDAWEAPEISPWFDSRMAARLREETERRPEGLFARLRDRFLFSSRYTARPLLASSMGLLLLVIGGTYSVQHYYVPPAPASAAVQDLQRLDNNAVALQQMDQLEAEDNGPDDGGDSHS